MARLLTAVGLSFGLAWLTPAPAAAVEIVALTEQINPKSDPANTVDDTAIVEDETGGFTVVWSRREDDSSAATMLYARSFDDAQKPGGTSRRFDQQIDGAETTGVRIAGGARLDGDRVLLGWEALSFGAQPRNPECVGSILRNDQPRGAPIPIDDAPGFVAGCRVLKLGDGRGLSHWSEDGNAYRARFVERDGRLGRAVLDIGIPNGSLARPGVVALDRGFVAFFARFPATGGAEILAQVHGEDGRPEGQPFTVFRPEEEFGILGAVGMTNGRFALLRYLNGANNRGEITGRVFSRAGKEVVRTTGMVRNALFAGSLPMVALDQGGFLLALEDGSATSTRLAVLRFGDLLRPVGPIATTKRIVGLRRSALRMLADGRAALSFVVGARRVFVAIIEP